MKTNYWRQEKHDIMLDKLSVKEYEDPFKGTTSQKHSGLNKVKASAFRRGLVLEAYSLRSSHPFDGWL